MTETGFTQPNFFPEGQVNLPLEIPVLSPVLSPLFWAEQPFFLPPMSPLAYSLDLSPMMYVCLPPLNFGFAPRSDIGFNPQGVNEDLAVLDIPPLMSQPVAQPESTGNAPQVVQTPRVVDHAASIVSVIPSGSDQVEDADAARAQSESDEAVEIFPSSIKSALGNPPDYSKLGTILQNHARLNELHNWIKKLAKENKIAKEMADMLLHTTFATAKSAGEYGKQIAAMQAGRGVPSEAQTSTVASEEHSDEAPHKSAARAHRIPTVSHKSKHEKIDLLASDEASSPMAVKLVHAALRHITGGVGWCAKAVSESLHDIGVNRADNAWKLGNELKATKLFAEVHDIQPGDIVVRHWSKATRVNNGNHDYGHIAVIGSVSSKGIVELSDHKDTFRLENPRYDDTFVLRYVGPDKTKSS